MENPAFVPEQQELLWDGMVAKFSVDRISFGTVPAGAVAYAVTTIRNVYPASMNSHLTLPGIPSSQSATYQCFSAKWAYRTRRK